MKRFLSKVLYTSFIALIALVVFLFSYDLVIYRIWASIISPHPASLILLPKPYQFTEIPPNDYYELEWSDDGTVIRLSSDSGTISHPEPDTIINLDVRSGEVINTSYQEVSSNDSSFYLRNGIMLDGDDESTWVKCSHQDITINLKDLDDDNHSLSLYQNNTLSATFTFSPVYPGHLPGYQSIRFMSFSPKCDYFVLTLDGWAFYEGYAREELWLLDISKESFNPIVIGRWPLIKFVDYPVQSVWPNWSPDGTKLVFGDKDFGLEVYDIKTSSRSRLTDLKHSGWDPKWSSSGKWIATEQWFEKYESIPVLSKFVGSFDKIIILSQDGKYFSSSGDCSMIYDFKWSPVNDQLAYLCHDKKSMTASLWIWIIEPPEK